MSTALLVIDMQRAYFNNSALEENKQKLIEACNELIVHAKSSDMLVINARTEHKHDQATWTLNMLDDDAGYLYEGEEDVKNVEGLNIDGAIELIKTRDSAFYGTNLISMLSTKGIDRLIICGVSTHSCIMLTAADAYAANIRVTLASDAIGSHDPRFHESTLDMLKQEYRQDVMTTRQIIHSITQ